MQIESIEEQHWEQILQIQRDAYIDIAPESLEVLQSKVIASPETCFVALEQGKVAGYLLAHPWDEETLPPLFLKLDCKPKGRVLYIHDLAVAKGHGGRGIGRFMAYEILAQAKRHSYAQVNLVAVNNASKFWSKLEFKLRFGAYDLSSYGEGAVVMGFEVESSINGSNSIDFKLLKYR